MLTRRQFLRGRLQPRPVAVRPPWALDEDTFTDRCTRCGNCVGACPSRIVVNGDGGYPEIDFRRGECTFCGDCAAACREGVLRLEGAATPWSIKAEIGTNCLALKRVECRICGEQCAARAIRFRLQPGAVARPVVDAQACNGCGACVAACPSTAITVAAREPAILA